MPDAEQDGGWKLNGRRCRRRDHRPRRSRWSIWWDGWTWRCGEYLAIGASSSLRLGPPQIRTVLGWALLEATGEAYKMPVAQTETEFFMAGLLEEITQIPSNTFEEVEFPDGTLRYVPLAADIWRQCLEIYRGRLGGDAAAEREGKKKTPKPRRR
ncbi:MAG: hypothetical protein HC901_02995 [Bdellovibrionaceae bacterium]|nr:hypothetical protein [Pseudobdellovibrionaceae bacterium]